MPSLQLLWIMVGIAQCCIPSHNPDFNDEVFIEPAVQETTLPTWMPTVQKEPTTPTGKSTNAATTETAPTKGISSTDTTMMSSTAAVTTTTVSTTTTSWSCQSNRCETPEPAISCGDVYDPIWLYYDPNDPCSMQALCQGGIYYMELANGTCAFDVLPDGLPFIICDFPTRRLFYKGSLIKAMHCGPPLG